MPANTLTPQDVYQIINLMAKQSLGDGAIQAVDPSSFVAVGETIMRTGTENTLNALSTVLARTIFSTRPYRAKLQIMRTSAQRWGAQTRKIVFLYSDAESSQDWNTNLNPNQLDDGNSIDMYKIKKPKALQLNFYGTAVLQKHITRFRDQLSLAFSSETEFIRFIEGVMVEFNNEVEILNEQKGRGALLNMIAGINAMSGSNIVDLVATFNTQQGTAYTREQIFSAHLTEFMQHVAAQVKIFSRRLTDIGFNYHATLTGYDKILRHTPQARQRMIMYEPLFIEAEARVYSQLFNPSYLEIGDFEGVNYWQNQNDPTHVNVTPKILDLATGESTMAATQDIPYVLGLLYDEEALGVTPQFDYASTTPFNSAGGYYNMFLHWRFHTYNDFTENAILFILGNGGSGTVDTTRVVIDNAPVQVTIGDGHGETTGMPLYVQDVPAAPSSDEPVQADDTMQQPVKARSKK